MAAAFILYGAGLIINGVRTRRKGTKTMAETASVSMELAA